jgi:hypothetical protein
MKSGWDGIAFEALAKNNQRSYYTLQICWTIKPKPSEDKIKHLAQALQGFCSATISATWH